MTQFLTAKELAARWKTSEGNLANLRSQGKGVPFVKPMGTVLYKLEDVENFENDTRN